MSRRLPLLLSLLALAISVAGSTPLGAAAENVVKEALFAQRAGYATDAGAVGGIQASAVPEAGKLLPLGPDLKLPAAVLPLDSTVHAPNLAARIYSSTDLRAGHGEVDDPTLGAMRLRFDRVAFDTARLFSKKHPTRLTAPADGVYLITADIAFRAAPHLQAGANRGVALLVDGQTVARSQLPPADQPFVALTTIYKLQKGDYVEVAVSDDDPVGPLPVVSLFGSMPSLSLAWMAPG